MSFFGMSFYAARPRCAERIVKPKTRPGPARRCSVYRYTRMAGFSYIEVLIAMSLIAITLVPAMDALVPGVTGSAVQETYAEDYFQLIAIFEDVMAEPIADLDDAATAAGNPATATSYSDVFSYTDGRQITRNVFISRYDGDNADNDNDPFTGIDAGLLWIRVEIAGTKLSMESLISEYD